MVSSSVAEERGCGGLHTRVAVVVRAGDINGDGVAALGAEVDVWPVAARAAVRAVVDHDVILRTAAVVSDGDGREQIVVPVDVRVVEVVEDVGFPNAACDVGCE